MKSKTHDYQYNYLKRTKNTITLLVVLLISISSFAQQKGINYKAVIKDDLGNVITGQDVRLEFTIISINDPYYVENQLLTPDENGIVIARIGEGTQSGGFLSFDGIPWDQYDFDLEVKIDITGGTNYVDLGRTPFGYVPYALTAGNVSTKIDDLSDGKSDPDGSSLFIGFDAGLNDDGSNNGNVGVGNNVLRSNTIGGLNSAIGWKALNRNTTGDENTAIGLLALNHNIIGNFNTAIGSVALEGNTIGNYNTANGFNTLFNNTTGSYNTSLGVSAGSNNVSGNRNVFIGYNSGSASQNESDKLYISNSQTNAPLIYGEFDTNLIRIGGSLSIQNASDATSLWRLETRPNGSLSLYRNGDYRGFFNEATGVYSSISDRRTKKEITPMENGTLNKVMQLNPVSYLMKDQTDKKRNLGLISQEVQEIFPSITTYVEESDLIALSYTELIPILIKALQEQQDIIDNQNSRIKAQATETAQQNSSIESLLQRMSILENLNN